MFVYSASLAFFEAKRYIRSPMDITVNDRRQLAGLIGCNEQYLYQCLTGRNAMQPIDATRAERVTAGRLRRWHVRPKDWHLIWPELIGHEGAPPVDAVDLVHGAEGTPPAHVTAEAAQRAA